MIYNLEFVFYNKSIERSQRLNLPHNFLEYQNLSAYFLYE